MSPTAYAERIGAVREIGVAPVVNRLADGSLKRVFWSAAHDWTGDIDVARRASSCAR
jgi:hypothetical protein